MSELDRMVSDAVKAFTVTRDEKGIYVVVNNLHMCAEGPTDLLADDLSTLFRLALKAALDNT